MKESDLYPPLKLYLESQGYEIKGGIGHRDVFAIRNAEPLLIVELKLSLDLTVVLQAVDRLILTSSVYIGVPKQCSALKRKYKQVSKLLKLLGIGLITIDPLRKSGCVKILLDPGEYKPRISKNRVVRLLGEFEKRVGDPNQRLACLLISLRSLMTTPFVQWIAAPGAQWQHSRLFTIFF